MAAVGRRVEVRVIRRIILSPNPPSVGGRRKTEQEKMTAHQVR